MEAKSNETSNEIPHSRNTTPTNRIKKRITQNYLIRLRYLSYQAVYVNRKESKGNIFLSPTDESLIDFFYLGSKNDETSYFLYGSWLDTISMQQQSYHIASTIVEFYFDCFCSKIVQSLVISNNTFCVSFHNVRNIKGTTKLLKR